MLPLALLGGVPSAIAASPADLLAADQESDRTENLDDAIDAALDAAQAHRAAKAPPKVPQEFSLRINAPLYDNSNVDGHGALESDLEIALGWSRSLTSLPFKLSVKLKASTDRYANVPHADEDQVSGSFRLSYYDAGNDQAGAPFFLYNPKALYDATFSPWIETKNDFDFGINKSFNFNGDFRLLPATANSGAAAIWTLGVTAYVQRRVRTLLPDSRALYLVPSATYAPSADWVILLTVESWERWYESVPTKPIARRDFEIQPILTIAYDPPMANGLGSPQIALQIGFDSRFSNIPKKSYDQWTVGPVLSAKWKF
ncbi:MAG: hypothetical protein JO081_20975 [Alphaproteobacteria bacterium]|nr:hypothetical protein [Alphaproteobacteria bacterium]